MSFMKITALVENTSFCELKPKHGISFYIETRKHKILFDLGPDRTLFNNAAKRNIDLTAVDTVIISHGHSDHGGALGDFLKINNRALVYLQREAFDPHFTGGFGLKFKCQLDSSLKNHPQVVLLDGDHKIDDELELFVAKSHDKCFSPMNNSLYNENGLDDFQHEHNLIIHEAKEVLIMGCGHSGVVNILEAKPNKYDYCIGGFHLFNPVIKKTVKRELLEKIAAELSKYPDTKFYTCHCTGMKTYNYLKDRMPLEYMSCGMELEI